MNVQQRAETLELPQGWRLDHRACGRIAMWECNRCREERTPDDEDWFTLFVDNKNYYCCLWCAEKELKRKVPEVETADEHFRRFAPEVHGIRVHEAMERHITSGGTAVPSTPESKKRARIEKLLGPKPVVETRNEHFRRFAPEVYEDRGHPEWDAAVAIADGMFYAQRRQYNAWQEQYDALMQCDCGAMSEIGIKEGWGHERCSSGLGQNSPKVTKSVNLDEK